MKKKLFKIFLLVGLYFSLIPLCQGLYTDRNLGGHEKVIEQGVNLKKAVHGGDPDGGKDFSDWVDKAAVDFKTGARAEDSTIPGLDPAPEGPNGYGNYFEHFLDPDTGKGLFSGFFRSAIQRAIDYLYEVQKITGYNCPSSSKPTLSPADIRKLNDYLGRIKHLIADMANPDHTQDKSHVFDNEFEKYVAGNWAQIVDSDVFKSIVNRENYNEWIAGKDNWTMNDPEKFISELARISKGKSSGSSGMTQEQYAENVGRLIGEAVKYTAGYIDAIYKGINGGGQSGNLDYNKLIMLASLQTNIYELSRMVADADGNVAGDSCALPPDPVSPAGDHPDDRFDVSDEFYWEKEFNLTDVDLTKLYLRTAIKKGKVGIWYKDQFMQTFFEGRTKYKDAAQDVKDGIEARFQALGDRLKQRKNEAESDWKGAPDIALLANGFYNPSISLMLKIGEPVSFQGVDFNPEIVRDQPVMFVPTGGFYGLKNSDAVKTRLEEYVKNGGTLVLLAQRHGYDWGLLPTPADPATGDKRPVSGYGYQEDQSCQFNSVYIDTYYSILSVFSTSTANIGVDGYFTSYPEGSTILLRRTANGQPAMRSGKAQK
jgi:hypothetical protein